MGPNLVLVDAQSGGTLQLSWAAASSVQVVLRLEALHASTVLRAVDDVGLRELMDELATHWQGWRGAREWASLEDDLRLRFTHDGAGLVNVGVTLRRFEGEAWEVKTSFGVLPASLERLAQDVRTFFDV